MLNHKTCLATVDVGCSQKEFVRHMRDTMAVPPTRNQTLAPRFHMPLRNFDLSDPKQLKKAFHFTNMYAVVQESHLPGGYRRRTIPINIAEARKLMTSLAWV